MITKFAHHIMLIHKLDKEMSKLYYFRHDDNDNYECEEYTYRNKQVLDLKYGQSSKEYFDQVYSEKGVVGAHPSTYFGNKEMGFVAFGENWGNP